MGGNERVGGLGSGEVREEREGGSRWGEWEERERREKRKESNNNKIIIINN